MRIVSLSLFLSLSLSLSLLCCRIGGAYGGKSFLPVPVAAATAAAALVLGVPILTQLDRSVEFASHGGRPPASANFTCGFDPNSGKIEGEKERRGGGRGKRSGGGR
jgi:xanthine dehydrogenase molybdopterin-binding subunit B